MNGGDLSAATAGRLMALGWRRPRAAMREAAGIGETGRLALWIVSGLIVVLADPGEDGMPRFVAGQAALWTTTGAALGEVALWSLAILGVCVLLYATVTGILWLATRPAPTEPSFASLRSAIAVASWISTLPLLAVSLIFLALGRDMIGGALAVGLWSAYAGICLSEATGIDARAGTGLAFGSTILAFIAIVAGGAAVYVTLLRGDLDDLVQGMAP